MRLMTAVLMFVLSTPAMAEVVFPVSIPQECFELANREGVPTVIENKYQAAKAKLKLYRLSNRDPLVRECKHGVEQQKAAMQSAAATPPKRTSSGFSLSNGSAE